MLDRVLEIYLSLAEFLHVAERPLGDEGPCGMPGCVSPRWPAPSHGFRVDACPTLETKAASLPHSLAHDRGLVDGNNSLVLAATIAFLGINGHRPTLTNDEAYHLVMGVVAGQLREIAELADTIKDGSRPR